MRFLPDEGFNGPLFRALLARMPGLDLVRVQDVGLSAAIDPDVLEWASVEWRIVLTHDKQTMIGHANARVTAGHPMPGAVYVDDHAPSSRVLDELEVMVGAGTDEDFKDQVRYVPM